MTLVLRDFLYLDNERVRSILAQLSGGVVEQSVERLVQSDEARASGSFFKLFELGGSALREKATEQTRSMQDAMYLLFEDASTASGLFNLDVEVTSPEAWEDGSIHRELQAGQLLRITAPTRIVDSQHVRQRVERFAEWPRLIASFTLGEQLQTLRNPKDRDKRIQAAAEQSMGGPGSIDSIRRLGEFIDVFLAGQISIRQFPCGPNHRHYAFGGSLLGRAGYLQEEREALFAKYGSTVTDWTVVSQVATVTEPLDGSEDLQFGELVNAADQIDRSTVEDAAIKLMHVMETLGVAEGPTYPAIAVTPLAVYREFSPNP